MHIVYIQCNRSDIILCMLYISLNYIYIYMNTERERERYIYIYIYIYLPERASERMMPKCLVEQSKKFRTPPPSFASLVGPI